MDNRTLFPVLSIFMGFEMSNDVVIPRGSSFQTQKRLKKQMIRMCRLMKTCPCQLYTIMFEKLFCWEFLSFYCALLGYRFRITSTIIEGLYGKTTLVKNFNFDEYAPKVYHRSVQHPFHQFSCNLQDILTQRHSHFLQISGKSMK